MQGHHQAPAQQRHLSASQVMGLLVGRPARAKVERQLTRLSGWCWGWLTRITCHIVGVTVCVPLQRLTYHLAEAVTPLARCGFGWFPYLSTDTNGAQWGVHSLSVMTLPICPACLSTHGALSVSVQHQPIVRGNVDLRT